MKTKFLFLLLFIAMVASAQKKFSINIGTGMSSTLGESPTVPDFGIPKGSPYFTGFVSGYYKITDNFSLVIQFLATRQHLRTKHPPLRVLTVSEQSKCFLAFNKVIASVFYGSL